MVDPPGCREQEGVIAQTSSRIHIIGGGARTQRREAAVSWTLILTKRLIAIVMESIRRLVPDAGHRAAGHSATFRKRSVMFFGTLPYSRQTPHQNPMFHGNPRPSAKQTIPDFARKASKKRGRQHGVKKNSLPPKANPPPASAATTLSKPEQKRLSFRTLDPGLSTSPNAPHRGGASFRSPRYDPTPR